VACALSGKIAPPWWTVLGDIDAERHRQMAEYGDQHLPDGTGNRYYVDQAERYKAINDARTSAKVEPRWAQVLLEEAYEAVAETDIARLRAELVQVAAVCVSWVQDLDSRRE
jgi:hypothetical protein